MLVVKLLDIIINIVAYADDIVLLAHTGELYMLLLTTLVA